MYKAMWEEFLLRTRISNGHIISDCPICNESGGHFYANITTGLWDCKKCQMSGNAWKFLEEHKKMPAREIYKTLERLGIYTNGKSRHYEVKESPKEPISKKTVEYFKNKLTEEKLLEFSIERGLSPEILKRYEIGINDNNEITLPVYDQNGLIRNIFRKIPGGSTISIQGGEAILFGIEDLLNNEIVFMVEGPWSALSLKDKGYKAIGTCGAGVLKEEQIPLFKGKTVYVIPDNDDAGKLGAEKILKKLKGIAKQTYLLNIPVNEKQDIRNFFQNGGTKEQFDELVKAITKEREFEGPLPLTQFLKKEIPPVDFYVMDMIQKSGKAMISAAPNIGKSIFVQNIALDIASGKSNFMGKFDISQARVLYLDLEMGESALLERFKKFCNVLPNVPDNLFICNFPALDLLQEDYQKKIEEWITFNKIDLLIIDPLGNAWCGKENDQEEVRKLTGYLNVLIKKYQISVLVVHHWRKATKEHKTGGQMAAGSYVWEAWPDTHITLEGTNNTAITISCHKNRNRPKFEPFLAAINPENLSFEFIADAKPKFDENTLINLFESFGTNKVSIKELKARAVERRCGSDKTIRRLIETSRVFTVDKSQKEHFLVKNSILEGEIQWEE